jgi:L-lactate dehydrogenase complex protein LldG
MMHTQLAQTSPAPVGLWEVFDRKAAALGVTVLHVADDDSTVAKAILDSAPDVVATDGLTARFPSLAGRLVAASNQQAASHQVAGTAAWAVAETGSLLVSGSNADRAKALLADRLCLVVRAEDIVASLDEALVRTGELIAQGNRYATFMSGPSRTADIERTLTIGVHGPGAMLVIVIGGLA